MSFLIYNRAHPSETISSTKQRQLADISFPVVFKICIKPAYNVDQLEKAGYISVWDFFVGCSMYNGFLMGWAGHTEDGKAVSNVSGCTTAINSTLHLFLLLADIQARVVTDAHSRLRDVFLYLMTDPPSQHNVTQLVKSKRLSFPHNCLHLDLAEEIAQKNLKVIGVGFTFYPFPTTDGEAALAEIVVEERVKVLYRESIETKKNFWGPKIETGIGIGDPQKVNRYVLSFEQDIYVEEDQDMRCKKYPWKGLNSFNDCDEDYMQNWVNKKYNFLPIFMAKEQTNSTVGPIEVGFNCSLWESEYTMFLGYKKSSCPMPCTRTKMDVKHLMTDEDNHHRIEILFSESLMVTRHFFPDPSLAEGLASLGGSMGLWLGLGVLQLLQLLTKNVIVLFAKATKTNQVEVEE